MQKITIEQQLREAIFMLMELDFNDKSDFQAYISKHKIRDKTKIKIRGRETTAGSVKKSLAKSGGKINPNAPNPHFTSNYGKLGLNAYPPSSVEVKSVKVNTSGDINTHAVLQWKDPKSGRTVSAYTSKYIAKNAKIKWKRVQRIKPEYIDGIYNKSIRTLRSRNPIEKDAAAIIAIITKTGLRPGSVTGLNDTGNKGVSTLGPENIKIDGDKITINFVGKSYKQNNAVFKDPDLAAFLSKRIQQKKDDKFLFDSTDAQVRSVFSKRIGRKGMKIKDLRTYTATKMAKSILEKDKFELPENEKQIKKAIKNKLKQVFEEVSQKLNNTPAMAKSSYVHPKVIEDWLKTLGVEPTLIK